MTSTVSRKELIAEIGDQAIYEEDLPPRVQAQLRQLSRQAYEIKLKALESLVNQRLLEAEAKARNLSTQKLLQKEVDSAAADPTESEVEAYYLGQTGTTNRLSDEVTIELRQALKQARIQQARREYVNRFREKADVRILLNAPKIEVSYDRGRLRGSPTAPVIIVEFADFQCPFCRSVETTLKKILAKYGGRVALAYRDFPLSQIHAQAQIAAEASRCAGEQGKFWEYHDLLFANPGKLDRGGLLEHARSLGLDMKQFDSCLASGKYKAQIEGDLREGIRAGVSGTPSFFINGSFLSGAQPASAFEETIESELAAAKLKARATAKK